MAALLALLPAAGHDQLWFLLMARRWLAGATLYGPEAFDSNPPAIVWLSALPVALGNVLHVPATLPAKLLVTLLQTACALLSLLFLPHAWRKPSRPDAAALVFAAIVLFYVVPARDFGQRDHLVSFLLLPYVLAAADPVRTRHRSPRIAASLLAALAICLKPHHALVPLVLEAALLLVPQQFPHLSWSFRSEAKQPASGLAHAGSASKRTAPPSSWMGWNIRLRSLLRPEPAVLLAAGALSLFTIHHFAPLYFTDAVPITRQVYAAIGHLAFPQLLWEAVELCLLAALALWLAFRQPASSGASRLLLLAGAASFAAYLIQGTGWYYQQLPALSFFGLVLALQLLDLVTTHPLALPAWLPTAAAGLVLLALALTAHFTGYPFTRDRAFAFDSPDPALFANLQPDTPVAILTTSVDEAMMPIERFHLTWAQRTDNLWLLPEILRAEHPEGQSPRHAPSALQLKALDTLQHRWMVEDLTRWTPELVLIERCQEEAVRCQVLEDRHDDLLAWFQQDPSFAVLWQQHYTCLRTDARFNVYRRH